jgi:hypothetical protein
MEPKAGDLSPSSRKRGRFSAEVLTTILPDARMQRPEPPDRLTPAEKAIWREIVEKVRGGWFYSSEHLLEAYVCTVAYQQQLGNALQGIEVGSERYMELARMQLSVTALLGNLATKLRLTPRSTIDRYTPKAVRSEPRPWQPPPA